ncbi:2-oxoglutarate-Fe(II) type oxidoreductase-like isoform X1 [Cucurbita moschata]|uniref:2-oxoglutarate-Fe(II) type oxidoreductase-like isoform X1 n=1 Tax=Cucurbita moschata TaxID=3662 RepID=A0A6J1E687_CUCMO|nr:2-oxoglutarate-Fe(II) type oxidoreductase-like isoform X1 [Cucurbita moschata]XP_022923379.1 2-oxoglutarate-Fe(II) type oxidoreductase-like isoform X1 [Cucurbita moschata]
MASVLQLPIIDLSSQDRASVALSIHEACLDYGFFYLINHGVEDELLERVFDESRKFFSLPIEEKMKLARKEHRGYTALYAEKLDPTASTDIGDAKESYYIGPLAGNATENDLNQWPSGELLPSWRATMESFYKQALRVGRQIISLLALALNLDENFFEKIGAFSKPSDFLRLLHYPGDLRSLDEEILGASAHSDWGMITLLVTNGIPGLQICKEKSDHPQVWEDVAHIDKAFVVNVGDLMERWTNCLFRSTLHRVIPVGEERYSVAFFLHPSDECVVECLPSCCSESSPPRYPPISSMDYLKERVRLAYKDGFA